MPLEIRIPYASSGPLIRCWLAITSAATRSLHCASGLRQCQGYKGLRAKGNGPGKTKTEAVVADAGHAAVAICRPAAQRSVEPAAAADHAVNAPGFIDPGTCVIGCAFVVVVPVIFHPFPDIAMHIVKTPWIRLLSSDPMGSGIRI